MFVLLAVFVGAAEMTNLQSFADLRFCNATRRLSISAHASACHSANCNVVQVQALQSQLQACQDQLHGAQAECTANAEYAAKLEGDLASLTEAYHDVQRTHGAAEAELQSLRAAADASKLPNSAAHEAVQPGAQEEGSAAEVAELQQEMDDLLVCLGQEEQKVSIFSSKLQELGVNAGALIAHIGENEGDEDGDVGLAGDARGDTDADHDPGFLT